MYQYVYNIIRVYINTDTTIHTFYVCLLHIKQSHGAWQERTRLARDGVAEHCEWFRWQKIGAQGDKLIDLIWLVLWNIRGTVSGWWGQVPIDKFMVTDDRGT